MAFTRSIVSLLAALLVLPLACGNDDGVPVGASNGSNSPDEAPVPELVCPAYDASAYSEMDPLSVEKASFLSPLVGAFNVSPSGSPSYSIPLQIPPARFAPNVGLFITNGGVSVAGLSSISRCGSNLAHDDQIRGVTLTAEDNYCLNGSRLIQINTGKDDIGSFAEYRTWPDSNTKILGYGATAADGFDVTYFVAYRPDGNIATYGKGQNSRTSWRGVTKTWKIELEQDRGGNSIRYDDHNTTAGTKDFTTCENVSSKIRHTGFVDDNGVVQSESSTKKLAVFCHSDLVVVGGRFS